MAEWRTPEAGEILIYSCLAPETARAVFLSTMVAAIGEYAAFEMDTDGEACLAEWVAGLDMVFTMSALSIEDAEVPGVIAAAYMTCNPDLIISAMLDETGLALEDLSDEEASCLRATTGKQCNTTTQSPLAILIHARMTDFFPNRDGPSGLAQDLHTATRLETALSITNH